MTKQVADKLMWKKRNTRFLMVFSPLMVLAFTIIANYDQYRITSRAIREGHSVGFQFYSILPIVMGLSFWIVALLAKCELLEARVAALEEKQSGAKAQ